MTSAAATETTPHDPEPHPEFLEVDPPHWAANGLAYVMILLFLTALVATAVVHVPETVSGQFVLVPVRGTDPVRAAHGGVITEVRAVEGEAVPQGQTLFVVRSDPLGDRSAELRTVETQLKGSGVSLANARSQYENQRLADQKELRNLQTRAASLAGIIDLKKQQLALARERAERYRKGQEGGFTSWEEYSQTQMEADNLAVQVAEAETQRVEARAAADALRHEMQARLAQFQELERSALEQTTTAGIRKGFLERELEGAQGNLLSVSAPCAGAVLRLRVRSAGAVVQEGEVLTELACSGEGLQAELTVPQKGIALLRPGQPVKLLYDAFPYQRYGVRRGTVRWISPMGIAEGENAAFRALVDIKDAQIRVRGQPRPLRVGMGGRANVVVGKRSLVSYAFEPIRQLRESLAETPQT